MKYVYQLDKVIILSRHGIRTPLSNTLEFLHQVSPHRWPTWHYPGGYLTTRGGALEAYFGHYFSSWLTAHNFHLSDFDKELFVYANSVQRTVATAQFFMAGAFAGHNISINHQFPIEKMDPIFAPILRDDSPEFKQSLLDSINYRDISEQLTNAYDLLSDILDYRHSHLYKQYQCELKEIQTTIHLDEHREPVILGPLALGTAVADAFLLQYYSAFAQHDVAWGKINSMQKWQQIVAIRNHYIHLLYYSKSLAKHIAKSLVNLINDLVHHRSYRLSFLVGHDSNIASLLGALQFEDYCLTKQFEQTPIGGKLVLQRFYHQKSNQYYFKSEYWYQSFEQLRFGEALSVEKPPQCITLKFEDTVCNEDGFYSWTEFVTRLQLNLL